MYSVIIAVCLLATPASNCEQDTAAAWIIAPEHQATAGDCMRHGLLYAASSGVVIEGSYAKVFCSAGQRTAGAQAKL
jgi:hypothetical protein